MRFKKTHIDDVGQAKFIVLSNSYFDFEKNFYPIAQSENLNALLPYVEELTHIYQEALKQEEAIAGECFKQSVYYKDLVKHTDRNIDHPYYLPQNKWGLVSYRDRIDQLEHVIYKLKRVTDYEGYVYKYSHFRESIMPELLLRKEGGAWMKDDWMFGDIPFLDTPWIIWRYMAEVSDFIKNIKDDVYRSSMYINQLTALHLPGRLFNDYEWDKRDAEKTYRFLVSCQAELCPQYEPAYQFITQLLEKYLAGEFTILVTSYWG